MWWRTSVYNIKIKNSPTKLIIIYGEGPGYIAEIIQTQIGNSCWGNQILRLQQKL